MQLKLKGVIWHLQLSAFEVETLLRQPNLTKSLLLCKWILEETPGNTRGTRRMLLGEVFSNLLTWHTGRSVMINGEDSYNHKSLEHMLRSLVVDGTPRHVQPESVFTIKNGNGGVEHNPMYLGPDEADDESAFGDYSARRAKLLTKRSEMVSEVHNLTRKPSQ